MGRGRGEGRRHGGQTPCVPGGLRRRTASGPRATRRQSPSQKWWGAGRWFNRLECGRLAVSGGGGPAAAEVVVGPGAEVNTGVRRRSEAVGGSGTSWRAGGRAGGHATVGGSGGSSFGGSGPTRTGNNPERAPGSLRALLPRSRTMHWRGSACRVAPLLCLSLARSLALPGPHTTPRPPSPTLLSARRPSTSAPSGTLPTASRRW